MSAYPSSTCERGERRRDRELQVGSAFRPWAYIDIGTYHKEFVRPQNYFPAIRNGLKQGTGINYRVRNNFENLPILASADVETEKK